MTPGEPSLSLRGRDLRFARLDRTDLHQADMTGANLDGASFIGADLRAVWMGCVDLNVLLLTDSRRAARCASARGANFAKARLADARMAGIDLREAKLEEAQLERAQLAHASMSRAPTSPARVSTRADLTGASLHGANFILASLQGADLTGAKLQMADFSNAGMQGATLMLAKLEAASLRDAELDGASLQMARLAGADLSGAKLQGSDMRGAMIWRTRPPGGENPTFADMAQIFFQPPAEDELIALGASLAQLENGPLKARLAEGLARLSDTAQNSAWAASPEQQLWQGFAKASEAANADGYKGRLTEYLARLMCRSRFASGAVATGVARRAVAPSFQGDMPALYVRLRGTDCAATPAMSPRLLRDLATAADAARGQ